MEKKDFIIEAEKWANKDAFRLIDKFENDTYVCIFEDANKENYSLVRVFKLGEKLLTSIDISNQGLQGMICELFKRQYGVEQ